MFPFMIMLVMPWIATMDIKEVKLTTIDHDKTPTSQRLIEQIKASKYFIFTSETRTYQEALKKVEADKADLIMEIPKGMEKELKNGNNAEIYIAANAVNSTKGGMGSGYLSSIISDFNTQCETEQKGEPPHHINIQVEYKYNKTLNYQQFMVPALMIVTLILLCGFFPTLNIVTEKEKGTIEQINVTPIKKSEFILSKVIFYGILGLAIFTIAFIIGKLVYGIAPYGGIEVIYAAAVLFLIFISGFGLLISNYSDTLQQAVFSMFFCMMLFMQMSGMFTPINSMATWAKDITYLLPPRYFVDIMRNVCQKGCGFSDLSFDFIMLCLYATIINMLAIATYKKQN